MVTSLEPSWTGDHRVYSNNPERFTSIDGSVETWSRAITTAADLPVECAALLPGLFATFPYCVRTPAMHDHQPVEPESFLFLGGSTLAIMKRTRHGVSLFRTDLGAVDALVTETALLRSCITFHPRSGRPEAVPFNTVVEDLFAPVISAYLKVRGTTAHETTQLRPVHPDPFDDLLARDYKYHAYAANVLPGDEARSRFYHPTESVPGLFNGTRLIPSYLLVASGSMLYCLSENAPFRSRNKADYSLMVRYIPCGPAFSIGCRFVKGENRYRMMVLQRGATTFELPLARALEDDFVRFARTAQLAVLPVAGLNSEGGESGQRKVG